MRFPFRAILIGLLIGAALFFAPFGFPFFFFFFFIFFIFRFFFGRRWGRWGYGYGSRWDYPSRNYYNDDITPIDGYGARKTWASKEGEKKVNIQ